MYMYVLHIVPYTCFCSFYRQGRHKHVANVLCILISVPPACLLDPSLGSHSYVTANGIKFHCVSAGDTSKPLMLCLHGFPEVSSQSISLVSMALTFVTVPSSYLQFWFSWRYQLKAFYRDYHVVAIDMRCTD